MSEHNPHLTIEELAEQVDMPVRTIRYYIAEGLLPGPEGRGKATVYDEEHLLRLRLIRLLSNQRMPLAEMSQLLNHLTLTEVQVLLAEEEQRAHELEQVVQPALPKEYIATLLKNARAVRQVSSQAPAGAPVPALEPSQPVPPAPSRKMYEPSTIYKMQPSIAESWTRWELAPGVELHIKDGVEEQHATLIERIFKIAGVPFSRTPK